MLRAPHQERPGAVTQPSPQDNLWRETMVSDPAVGSIVAALQSKPATHISVRGVTGSATNLLAGVIGTSVKRTVLLVTAHIDEADDAVDELASFGMHAVGFPAVELSPGESGINQELLGERLLVLRDLAQGALPDVVVAAIPALMQIVPSQGKLYTLLRTITTGQTLPLTELSAWLVESGYSRVPTIESPGDFAVRGGMIDVFAFGGSPVRLDFFGDSVEQLAEIDLASMGSDRKLDHMTIVSGKLLTAAADDIAGSRKKRQTASGETLLSYLPDDTVIVAAELLEISEQARSYFERAVDASQITDLASVLRTMRNRAGGIVELGRVTAGAASDLVVVAPVQPLPAFSHDVKEAVAELVELPAQNIRVLCQNEGEASRFDELLRDHGAARAADPDGKKQIDVELRFMARGFIWGERASGALALVPYHELLNRSHVRRRVSRLTTTRAMDAFLDLQPGDYVVHRDHGIARFAGLQEIATDKAVQGEEFLTLEFAGHAKLHVPVSKIELVQRYVGAMTGSPTLSTLGGKKWKSQKEQASEAVRDLAADMLRLQAAREALPGTRYPQDTTWQKEFDAEFPYEETEDQLAAIEATKRDMCSSRPMDRLVCGDVGFGKTEVAMRAAFKAAEFGKQVAVLVPTTVLAAQHERTFRERFSGYPFAIEAISRFRSKKEQSEILRKLAKGQIDIIIGTHRLLSSDVEFADLGLVVVDEEQRFGVEHKQRLLELRTSADVLTLSATPIPRTLHMAMLGLRDISSLTTPPLDRRAIVTEVLGFDERRIRQAIQRELAREGQVYFVHNRVHNINAIALQIQSLVPDARILVGHGQMGTGELEEVMLKFLRREVDVLVCTTIIESGIDIATANTMLINNADMFGLSELHQLRGRVGRSKNRAYCYLLLPGDKTLSEVALKRMRAIESFSMLGAGFRIALRDLEIRGAGNLLGSEQSGHIAAVGYEMYCQLLEHAVAELKHQPISKPPETVLELGVTGSLPRGYIPSDTRRMDAYRRVARADSLAALEGVRRDLESAYGDLPRSAETLLDVAAIRIAASALRVRSIVRHEDDIIFVTANPQALEQCMAGARGTLRMVGTPGANGAMDVYYRPPRQYLEPAILLRVLRKRLSGEGDESASSAHSQSKGQRPSHDGPRKVKPSASA